MKEPPMCPGCGEVLARVVAVGRSTWVYDQGHYHSIENKEATLSCPGCGMCLDELFKEDIYYWGIK